MKKFEVNLRRGKFEDEPVYKAGKIRFCKDTMDNLFVIPKTVKEIVVTVSDKKTPDSYKVLNDCIQDFDFDEDPDISLVYSNGNRQHHALYDGVKAEFLKHVSIPCYVSVKY